jgi:SEC-C motif-containing protein
MKECPCGSDFPYADCCGLLIRGAMLADTAEDLMRSRYTATVLGEAGYLRETLHPDERPPASAEEGGNSAIRFKRLDILGSNNGERGDEEGEVRFQAVYSDAEGDKTLRETSRFVKMDGRWYYSEKNSRVETVAASAKAAQPFVRPGPKVGRNDPCPCGSGKKFKKCCGK